jgi:acyl dehydratase
MALDEAIVGRTYASTRAYEVGREKIRDFADAIGDQNPAYRDPGAARDLGHRDVIAPPTFAIVITRDTSWQLIADPTLGLELHRVLHGEQRFAYTRPITAGDVLTTTLTVDGVKQAAGMDVVSTRTEIATADGEVVCTALSTLFHKPDEEGGA